MAITVKRQGPVEWFGDAWECDLPGGKAWNSDEEPPVDKAGSQVAPVPVSGWGGPRDDDEVPTGSQLWLFKGNLYLANDDALEPDDVLALINEVANRRRMQLEKAHAFQAMSREIDTKAKREAISQDVKVTVWQRDGGRCVECNAQEALEFDHIIPLSMGGANTMRNLQLLCGPCNRRKGASLG